MIDDRALLERIVRLEDRLDDAEGRIAEVPTLVARAAATLPTQARNLLRNANFGWNRARYLYAADPPEADALSECAHWYISGPYTPGTELLTDAADDDTDADPGTSSALMSESHSLYAAQDPDFDAVNGWARLGSDNLLCQPLAQNWGYPGQPFYVSFIAIYRPHVTDAGITAGTDVLNSATAGFVADDVGRSVRVYTTTDEVTVSFEARIKTFNSATQVQLENTDGSAFSAPATLSGVLALFSGAWPEEVSFGAGLYDNTSGQRKYIEGATDILGLRATVKGTPAATVSAKYRIVATTDWGDEIVSAEVTVNRPTDASYVTGSVYVLLQWTRVPGVLSYDIYLDTGGVLHLIYQSDTDSGAYADQGRREKTVGAWPTGSDLPVAYCAFRAGAFRPSNWYDDPSAWQAFLMPRLYTPAGYDRGLTTDVQWFVAGLTAALTGAGSAHALQLDQIMLATDPGQYSDSSLDEAAQRTQSVTMSGSLQGGVGTGGGGGGTNPGDEGGPRCPVESALISLPDGSAKRAGEVRSGDWILSGSLRPVLVSHVLLTEPVQIWRLETQRGKVSRGSASHPLIRHTRDIDGLALSRITVSEKALTAENGRLIADRVKSCTPEDHFERVVEIGLIGEHIYIADDILFHNVKIEQGAV